MPLDTKRHWFSFPALRQAQFAEYIANFSRRGFDIDDLAERIIFRRDTYEKLLLKNLVVQIALYAGLVITPTDGAFPMFGLPFKATKEVMLFLLGFAQILAIFLASRVKLQNDFIVAWQQFKFPDHLPPPINLAYGTDLVPGSWYPLPKPLQRSNLTAALTGIMMFFPALILVLMLLVGLMIGIVMSVEIWQHPSLQSVMLSRAIVVFYIFSYLLNLTYALGENLPLPYRP